MAPSLKVLVTRAPCGGRGQGGGRVGESVWGGRRQQPSLQRLRAPCVADVRGPLACTCAAGGRGLTDDAGAIWDDCARAGNCDEDQ